MLKAVTNNVSDLIPQCPCSRCSGRVNTHWSVFPIEMMKDSQVFLVTLILAHHWVSFISLAHMFFFPRNRKNSVKDHIKLVCAEAFQQKSTFLICAPVKNHQVAFPAPASIFFSLKPLPCMLVPRRQPTSFPLDQF